MAKRKTKSRNKKKNNSFTIFLVIVVVLALISFVVTYFVMQTDSSFAIIYFAKKTDSEIVKNNPNIEDVKTIPKDNTKSVSQSLILDGTWASYNDGAMLTINGQSFTIELPSVESTVLASGKIVVKSHTVTFVYTNNDSVCGIKPGVYNYETRDDEVIFSKQDDSCGSRVGLLVATWFKV